MPKMISLSGNARLYVGNSCCDIRLKMDRLRVYEKNYATDPQDAFGGGAGNQSVAGARLSPNRRIILLTHLGDDAPGNKVRQALDEHGVELPLPSVSNGSTSVSYIMNETENPGRGTIVTVPGVRSVPIPLDVLEAFLPDAEACCLCAPSVNDQIKPILSLARDYDVPAFVALGGAQIYGLSFEQIEDCLSSGAELVICNHIEARRVTGRDKVSDQLQLMRFHGRARQTIITCGDAGLYALDDSGQYFEPAYNDPQRAVVDDTGAGDATAAAVSDSLLRGLPLPEALAAGARNGFEACTAFGIGTHNTCTRYEMDAYLASRRRKVA